jgi:hypothetical protein
LFHRHLKSTACFQRVHLTQLRRPQMMGFSLSPGLIDQPDEEDADDIEPENDSGDLSWEADLVPEVMDV